MKLVDIDGKRFKSKVVEILTSLIEKYETELSSIAPESPNLILLPDGWIRNLREKKDYGPSSDHTMTKANAIKWCQEKGGYLPERFELETIQYLKNFNPCCDPLFKDMKSDYYWSNTSVSGVGRASFVVSFDGGSVVGNFESDKYYVRPVRASQ